MSFLRYRYKSDRDFKIFHFNGMSCSLGDLKRFLVGTPSKLASRRSRDDSAFIVNDAYTSKGLSLTIALSPIYFLCLL